MKTIFACYDNGTDGRDETLIGYCSNPGLSQSIVLGRGTFGVGNGEVRPIEVWETANDIPTEVQEKMKEKLLHSNKTIDQQVDKLMALLDKADPEARNAVLAKLQRQ